MYIDPEPVSRLANWFRLKATKRSMIDPRANENQLMFPLLENIRGTIKAAVIVGEITAMFCANNSAKLRQCGLSLFSGCVLMVVFLLYVCYSVSMGLLRFFEIDPA